MLTETQASDALVDLAEELAAPCWHDLCEKDDRSSPEDYPDHALITREELTEYIKVSLDMAQDPKALPRVMWRPIDTAPKNQSVLVRMESGARRVLYQTDHGGTIMDTWRNPEDGTQAGWPTLWMPLPADPQ